MTVVTDTTVSGLFECRGKVFIHSRGAPLQRVEDAARRSLEDVGALREAAIISILPGPNETCHAATRERGRFVLTESGGEQRPWPGGAMEGSLEDAVRGPGGALALATDTTIRLVDPLGQVQHLTSAEGLPSNEIHELYVSERRALWVATDVGIARVAWPSPVSVIDTPPALQSAILSITRHNGRLFVGTNEGLWRMESKTAEQVAGTETTYGLLSTTIGERPSLLAAGTHGLLAVRPDTVRSVTRATTYDVLQDRRAASVVHTSLYGDDGELLRVRYVDGAWQVVDRTDRVQTTAYTLAQDTSGALWLGTGHRGVYRIGPPLTSLNDAPVVHFDTSDGLPAPSFNYTTQLGDSVRFPTENGRVSVAVRSGAEAVEIVVEDTGVGIPEAERDAVFDRFQQVDDAPTRKQEGAGIGLAFAYDLVELHGGVLTVDSVEGTGTTFTVRLLRGSDHLSDSKLDTASDSGSTETPTDPADGPEQHATAPRPSPLAPSSLSSPSSSPDRTSTPEAVPPFNDYSKLHNPQSKIVLVVDDNADVRRYVRSVLEPDFAVIEARDGAEGVTRGREELPDVILADVMMPEVDGHEMTRRLKAEPETEAIPVIMVTARAATEDEVTGLQAGADDYVTKPFDAHVLRQRVGGVLTLQQRLRRRLEAELSADTSGGEDRPEIEREARRMVREHLTDSSFDVEALARQMAMSRSTLYRRLRDASDTTPSALLTAVRMAEARDLLDEGERVTQVAYAVGYGTLSTFSRVFREHVGTPPSTYAAV